MEAFHRTSMREQQTPTILDPPPYYYLSIYLQTLVVSPRRVVAMKSTTWRRDEKVVEERSETKRNETRYAAHLAKQPLPYGMGHVGAAVCLYDGLGLQSFSGAMYDIKGVKTNKKGALLCMLAVFVEWCVFSFVFFFFYLFPV